MKKIILLILLLALVACTPSGVDTTVSQPTQAFQQTGTPPRAPGQPTHTPVKLSSATSTPHAMLQVPPDQLNNLQLFFWHPWSGAMAQRMEDIVREFNETNVWGIQVYTTALGGSTALVDSVEENMPDGSLPNIILAPSEQILLWQQQHDLLTDLSVFISDGQWGLTEQEKADIPPLYWQADALEDAQLGLPAFRDMQVLYYNKTWAEELGFFVTPQTPGDFYAQACAAAAARVDIDETGGWIIDNNPHTIFSWILSGVSQQIYDARKATYRFNTPEVNAVFSNLRKMVDDGCAWNSRLPDPYEYFADRQALFYTGSLQNLIPQSAWMQHRQSQDEWSLLPFPENDGRPTVLVSSISYTMPKSTLEEQLAAWIFLRWLILPRHQALITEVSGLLPVSASTFESLETFRRTYPQWEETLGWIPLAIPAPPAGSWSIVQNILEDAAWQTFQSYTSIENISQILEQLDAMIPEVLSIIEKK